MSRMEKAAKSRRAPDVDEAQGQRGEEAAIGEEARSRSNVSTIGKEQVQRVRRCKHLLAQGFAEAANQMHPHQ